MKRKAIQLAKNTIVLSLPAKWVKQHGVQKGTELQIEEKGPNLKISTQGTPTKKEATLDAKNLNETVLRWNLSSLYKKGYTKIIINNPSKEQQKIIRNQTQTQFIGFAVTDQKNSSTTIRAIATEDPTAFETSLRRAFLVKLSLASQLLEHFKEDQDPTELIELEKTNNQLTDFCERLINSKRIDEDNAQFRYVIIWNLEKICDEYKYIAQYYQEPKDIDKKVLDFFEEVNNLVRSYYKLIYDYSEKDLLKASKEAKELWTQGYKLLNKSKDRVLMHHLLKIISSTRDFSTSIIGVHLRHE